MIDHYILNEHGEPVIERDIFKASKAWSETRRVALTNLGRFRVSTVFLFIDHGFGHGPPVLWETMVFASGHVVPGREFYSSRCSGSREQALAMHREAVKEVRRMLKHAPKNYPRRKILKAHRRMRKRMNDFIQTRKAESLWPTK